MARTKSSGASILPNPCPTVWSSSPESFVCYLMPITVTNPPWSDEVSGHLSAPAVIQQVLGAGRYYLIFWGRGGELIVGCCFPRRGESSLKLLIVAWRDLSDLKWGPDSFVSCDGRHGPQWACLQKQCLAYRGHHYKHLVARKGKNQPFGFLMM